MHGADTSFNLSTVYKVQYRNLPISEETPCVPIMENSGKLKIENNVYDEEFADGNFDVIPKR